MIQNINELPQGERVLKMKESAEKKSLNVKALTDEELDGVHGGMKIILPALLEKLKEKLPEMIRHKRKN